MSDDLAWKLGARTPGHDYKIFRTAFVEAAHPGDGHARTFTLVEAPDWVNIIALTPEDHVVLVRQFRFGTAQVCLEIPGGMVDPGEDALAAAKRELEEETGYTAREWRLLGTSAPNPAYQTNTLHSYLALDATRTMAPRPDGGEVIETSTLPLGRIQELIRSGRIDHALVLVAFAHLAMEVGELHRPPPR
jgi:8-oxo-dGTP pyrophosphatase MutT (NUDIX family)